MTEQELTQAIKDARIASQQIEIRDINGEIKTSCFKEGGEEDSEIEFNSDISSSTEVDIEQTNVPTTRVIGTDLRRSSRLTKTNPIVRPNKPVQHGFYRKRGGKAQQSSSHRRINGRSGAKSTDVTGTPETRNCLSGTPKKDSAQSELHTDQLALTEIPTNNQLVSGDRHILSPQFSIPEEGGNVE